MERKNTVMKSVKEFIGTVRHSEEHGNIKVIDFIEDESWGGKIIMYLNSAHMDNVIGSFQHQGTLTGGAMIFEKTDEPVTTYVE